MRWEERIQIAAPAADIVAVMTDVERWPEWNPACKSVRLTTPGALKPGSEAVVEMEGTPRSTFRVTTVDADGFTWETDVRGIHSVADHRVRPAGEGSQEVTLAVEMSGFMATMFHPLVGRVARKNLPREAEGLKQRAENRVLSQP